MTRINLVDPAVLTDQHLMAEYRELPMVMAALRRSLNSKRGVHGIPEQFTLNSGHVKFFYDKGYFLEFRYESLIEELCRRNYNIDPSSRNVSFDVFRENGLYNDFTPSSRDLGISVDRILLRIREKLTWYRYLGNEIDYNNYKQRIMRQVNVTTKNQN